MNLAWWRLPGRAWCALALLLALGTALAYGRQTTAFDWQPGLAATQPWRALSAAFVHYSPMHLAGNAAGLALTAAFGWAARVPPRLALAWAAAWPMTQLGLLCEPALAHYGGLSGVVHAGVAIVCVHVVLAGHRKVGGTIFAALLLKLASESPWGAPLQHPAGWDIAIAPLVHVTGTAAGLVGAAAAEGCARWRRSTARR